MKLRTASIVLIATGTTVLTYALFVMDISLGGSIINLDLLNTRQNLVTLGALGVLAGTILLATSILAKNSAPKDEPQQVDLPLQDKIEHALLIIEQLPENGLTRLKQLFERRPSKLDLLAILRVISKVSLIAPPFGVWIIFKFLFGPIADASPFQFFIGAALIAAPFLLKRYRRSNSSSPKTNQDH